MFKYWHWLIKKREMNRNFLMLVLAIVAIIFYVMVINILASGFSVSLPTTGNIEQRYNSGDVKLGFSDTVEVTVTRNRWYGKVIESSGQETKSSTLYLANFIKLPLNVKGKNFLLIHLIFLVLLIFFLYFAHKKIKIRDVERGFV